MRFVSAGLATAMIVGSTALVAPPVNAAASCVVDTKTDHKVGQKVAKKKGKVMSRAIAWRKPGGRLVLVVRTPTNQEVRMDRRIGGPGGDFKVISDPNHDGFIKVCLANTDLKVEVSAFTVNGRGDVTSLTPYQVAQPGRTVR